jgi:hypothetical protein
MFIVSSKQVLLECEALESTSELHELADVHRVNSESSLLELLDEFLGCVVYHNVLSKSHTVQSKVLDVLEINVQQLTVE